jgi:tetratricopeptide (TPR) repeat protein
VKYQKSSGLQTIRPSFLTLANWAGIRWLPLLVLVGILSGCQRTVNVMSPEEHFEQALSAIEQKDYSAIEVHLVALQDVPDFEPHVHLLRGALGSQVGIMAPEQRDRATGELMLALEHDDTRVPALVLIGMQRQDVQALEQALKINKNYVPAHQWLSVFYYNRGAMQNAHGHLQRIAELDPYDSRPPFLLGMINHDYRRFDLAEKNFEECLQRLDVLVKTPAKLHLPRMDRQEALVKLAAARIELREHAKAFEALEGALESRVVLCLRATALRALDRVDEARQYLDQGIKQFVDSPERSMEEDAVYQEARRLKGTMLIEDKKFGEARAVLEVLCKEYPFDARSLYKLVQAYRGLGLEKEAAEALKVYEPLRAKRERFSDLHIEAVSQPGNPDTRYELGKLALELGEGKLAVAWFNAALSIDPEHEETIKAQTELFNELYGVPEGQEPGPEETGETPGNEPAAKDPAAKEPKS